MAESGWLLAVLAGIGVRNASGTARPFLLACTAAASILALGCAALALPVGNEDNLFHGALVMLAVPAAGFLLAPRAGAETPRLGGARVGFAAIAFLPTLCIQVGASFGRPPVDLAFEQGRIVRADASSPDARLERWIRESTDPRAVFVIDPRPPIQAAAGNSAELPATTGRTLFTERAGHYLVAPEPDGARRAEIAAKLATGEPVSGDDDALLGSLARDVYVVCREPDRVAALEARFGPAVFRADPLSAFRWGPR
jgi:hypothetical protein